MCECCAALINEASVNVCCDTPSLAYSSAPLMCRHDRVTREIGSVGLGGGGDIEWCCTCIYCPASSVSVSLGV